MHTIKERSGNQEEFYNSLMDKLSAQMRVSIPAIVQSFDAETQTITAQPAIKERVRDKNGNLAFVPLPLLLDVPLVLPKAGNFVLTMPVKAGDECLIIFADQCMDSWWQSGGVQNWNDKRRHDLSDGFALLGTWSQPNKISNYSADTAQLRTLDGETYIELDDKDIKLKNEKGEINLKQSGEIKAFNDFAEMMLGSTGAIKLGNPLASFEISALGAISMNGISLTESYSGSASIVRNTASVPQSAVFE